MILDLNFYPEKRVETLKALPEIVLDCDLTGWTFHDLVRCLTTPSSCFGMGCTTSMRMARFAPDLEMDPRFAPSWPALGPNKPKRR